MTDPYEELDAITARLDPIEDERGPLRQRASEIVVNLLKANEPPTKVARRSPFSDAHVRALARAAGIPPAKRGGKRIPKAKP